MKLILKRLIIIVIVVVGVIASLRGLVAIGERVPMIEIAGAESVNGNLTLTPIRFAQTDFWFYPPRVDAKLGKFRVPALRTGNDTDTIDLRFVLFPTTNPDSTAAPVVYLAGGPGGMGVRSSSGDRFSLFMKLREAGDVIALDQRGTASSKPSPVCPDPIEEPLDRVVSRDELKEIYAPVYRSCFEHWASMIHPDAFTTAESVQDLEDLRLALGTERLSFVGISYGTHLALSYIRKYPDRVERAVLAGVEGPDHTWKRPAIVDGIVSAISDALESEAGWFGFEKDIEAAIVRLRDDAPVITIKDPRSGEPIDIALGPRDLKLAVLFGLGSREDFHRVAKRVRQIRNGNYEQLAKYSLRLRGPSRFRVMPISVDCASGLSDKRRQLIEAEMEGALIGDVANLSLETSCAEWPVTDLGPQFREPIESTIPVLAISGTLDSRTPPSNAEEALSGFADMHHLLIVGGGHDDDLLISSTKIGQAMVDFLRTGDPDIERVELPKL